MKKKFAATKRTANFGLLFHILRIICSVMDIQLGPVLLGRHIALTQECPVEGAGIAKTAQIRYLGDGVLRITQQLAGIIDAQRVNILTEIDVQALRKNMG